MPFCSVLHRCNVCVVCCVQGPPSRLEQMDVCCSRDGHRRAHRWISWDVVVIVGGEEVAILPFSLSGKNSLLLEMQCIVYAAKYLRQVGLK